MSTKTASVSSCTRILISYSSKSNEFVTELIHGKIMEKLGVPLGEKRFRLTPEECTYLVAMRQAFCYEDSNAIEAYELNKEPMSILKLYTILTENGVSLLRFSIFSSLMIAGFTVKPSDSSPSSDDDGIQYDYTVWHFSVPWCRSEASEIPPTYRLIIADYRFHNQMPSKDQLSKLSLTGDGTVVVGCGAVGTFSFLSVHGIPIDVL